MRELGLSKVVPIVAADVLDISTWHKAVRWWSPVEHAPCASERLVINLEFSDGNLEKACILLTWISAS